ncbi:MAG: hypothetical protein AB7S38_25925 [Vulcanimicrobiota bacterium]
MSRRHTLGISLLETVLGGIILALVIIFVSTLFPASLIAIGGSENTMQAEELAGSLLESMREVPFEQLAPLPPGDFHGDRQVLHYQTEVGPVPDSDPNFIKSLKVTVSWQERGRQRQVVRECWVHALRR